MAKQAGTQRVKHRTTTDTVTAEGTDEFVAVCVNFGEELDEALAKVHSELAKAVRFLYDGLKTVKRGEDKGVCGPLPKATGIWVAEGNLAPSFPAGMGTPGEAIFDCALVATAYVAVLVQELVELAGGALAEKLRAHEESHGAGILSSFCTLFIGQRPMNSVHTDQDETELGLIVPVFC